MPNSRQHTIVHKSLTIMSIMINTQPNPTHVPKHYTQSHIETIGYNYIIIIVIEYEILVM